MEQAATVRTTAPAPSGATVGDDVPSGPAGRLHAAARRYEESTASVLDRVGASHVVLVGVVMIGVATAVRAWVVYPAWFFLDDYVYLADAAQADLDAAWLMQPYNGHLMPGARGLIWLVAQNGPVNWPLAATTSLLMQVATWVACGWMLWRLFGPRPAALVPLAVFLTTATTLPGMVWWAAAINLLPVQVALFVAVTCWVEVMRGSGRWWLVGTALAVAGGLAFDPRASLVLPVLGVLTLAYFVPRPSVGAVWQLAREHWAAFTLVAAVGAAYSAYYLTAVEQVTSRPTAAAYLRLADTALGSTLPVGTVGGPWRWQTGSPPTSFADPPQLLVVLAWAMVVTTVVLLASQRRRTLRAWLPVLLHTAVLLWLVAGTRAELRSAAGTDYRFFTETQALVVLGLGLATMSLAGAPGSSEARPGRRSLRHPRLLVTVSSAVVVIGGLWSTVPYAGHWHDDNASAPYVQRLHDDLRAAGPVEVAEVGTPEPVLSRLVFPLNTTRTVAAPLADDVTFPRQSTRLSVIADDGSLRPATMQAAIASPPGPTPSCGWLADAAVDVDVPLTEPVPAGPGWLRVGYLTGSAADVTVTAGATVVRHTLPAGLGSLFVQHDGGFDRLQVTDLDSDAGLCIDVVEVGDLVPGATP